jgi:hypothetical protein
LVVRRALLAGVVGALAAALSLVGAYFMHPGLEYEMDRPLPSFIVGMYGNEHDAQSSYAWTSGHVVADIPGLDRQVSWSCTLRFRKARPENQPGPTVSVDVDGQPWRTLTAPSEYQDLGIVLEPRTNVVGAQIAITVDPTFVPGGADPRTLGVQVDRFLCRPSSPLVRPPSNTLSNAALATGIFAAGLALIGLSLSSAMIAASAIGLGQTLMLAIGSGMYGGYSAMLPWLALGVVFPAFVIARTTELVRRQSLSLSSSARFVIAVAASVMYLKMTGLLHPAKPVIDALFHAHRLDWVLEGRYFFVQPMPDGVTFPYAIGLYVFAAPWAWVTSDHVALIRAATVAADVIAGALLYPVLVAAWSDRRAAALASVLYQLAPLPLAMLANANLTNIFGESMALATIMAAVAWTLAPKRYGTLLGFAAVTAWALCSHVSTVTTLSFTLAVLAVLYWWRGDLTRRRAAYAIAIATALALVFAWVAYYGHFMDTYRMAYAQMFVPKGAPTTVDVKGNMGTVDRVRDLFRQVSACYGWPMLILAAGGVWSLARRRERDRLTSALIAWAVVWIVFSASTVFAGVGDQYVRYSAEFLGRINLATLPLVAILAARGAGLGLEPTTPTYLRWPLQVIAIGLLAWIVFIGLNAWLGWF